MKEHFYLKKWDKKYKKEFTLDGKRYGYYSLQALEEDGYNINSLPFSIKILLEALIRQQDEDGMTEEGVNSLAAWTKEQGATGEIPFLPARVILQDFTGVPVVLDLAAMRSAIAVYDNTSKEEYAFRDENISPDARTFLEERIKRINPEIPVDLVIDHSVQVDCYGSKEALEINNKLELQRNGERYSFLSWAKTTFNNLSIVPPSTGIVHQVNLEFLAQVVRQKEENGEVIVYPDTLVGTDSHTTMINGLGVLGWGVGGIEAEAGMLGQPSYLLFPEVIGVKLTGKLPIGTTATDLALYLTKMLRAHGVVDKFVEYYGEGVQGLSLADRASIANMAPEYGATCGFFPVDEETLSYLRLTGRSEEQIALIRAYLTENKMFQTYEKEAVYSEVLTLDLSTVKSALSGPKRPQDYIELGHMKESFLQSVTAPLGNQGHGLKQTEFHKEVEISLPDGRHSNMKTGSVVIAAITSCTNTSNPYVMLGAGILAKKAVEKGLSVPAHVKTSLTPGSKVVTSYLEAAGLIPYLNQLGFHIVGYGCATCIGNSGPLLPEIEEGIRDNDLLVTSVLSGNRNFEGRIHSFVKANYLASPILVIAYALAGEVGIDLTEEPLGEDLNGKPIYLRDIWPTNEEIQEAIAAYVTPNRFRSVYDEIYENEAWNKAENAGQRVLYDFDGSSTYIQNPPYFEDFSKEVKPIGELQGLRVLGKFGDSVTTDHISPAGAIGQNTPAGRYLIDKGVPPHEFNTYGSRRGNHEIMMRGTFANIRIRNQIAQGREGGYTTYWPTREIMPIYDAAMLYKENKTGLLVLAGKDYGMGSSRDWAAKGPNLLGVKAVLAESYERIHRSNLVMMGILPLQYIDGETAESLGLSGEETFDIKLYEEVKPKEVLRITATDQRGNQKEFAAMVRFDSAMEISYYRHGGILPMVLREKL